MITVTEDDVTVLVKTPTPKDHDSAKFYVNKVVSEILQTKTENGKPGFILRNKVKDYLTEAGIWGEEDEKAVLEIAKEINEAEEKLKKGGIKKSEGKQIALDIINLRERQLRILTKINELDNFTLESQAEAAEFDYLFSSCLLKEDGTKVFANVEEYKKAENYPKAYLKAAEEFRKILYGISNYTDILKDRIEYKFLVSMKFMNDDLDYIDKDGNKVDKFGRRIDENGNIVNNKVEELGEFLED